ncbi:MAG: hypothetical protein P8046_07995 [Anaerolineales bacterium]
MASTHPNSQSPSYDHTISAYFYLLIVEMVVTLAVAVVLYGEPFHFWEYAFSDLGSTATWSGKVNAPSRLVFTLGILAAGWIMLRIWAAFMGEPQFRNQTAKRNLGAQGQLAFC